ALNPYIGYENAAKTAKKAEESGLTRGLSMPDTAPSFECNPRGAAFAGKTPGNRLQSKSGLRFQKYWFNCNNCLKYHASWLFAN
ncbi:MAG: hypothetical protein ACI406_17350, partial [Victivallis vadensis]